MWFTGERAYTTRTQHRQHVSFPIPDQGLGFWTVSWSLGGGGWDMRPLLLSQSGQNIAFFKRERGIGYSNVLLSPSRAYWGYLSLLGERALIGCLGGQPTTIQNAYFFSSVPSLPTPNMNGMFRPAHSKPVGEPGVLGKELLGKPSFFSPRLRVCPSPCLPSQNGEWGHGMFFGSARI